MNCIEMWMNTTSRPGFIVFMFLSEECFSSKLNIRSQWLFFLVSCLFDRLTQYYYRANYDVLMYSLYQVVWTHNYLPTQNWNKNTRWSTLWLETTLPRRPFPYLPLYILSKRLHISIPELVINLIHINHNKNRPSNLHSDKSSC